ncbi:MAG: DUF2752 domain-containing protein [Blastocatellia bacterium]
MNVFLKTQTPALSALAPGALSALTLVTARWLTPSPTGVGTHRQLGFPPCIFLTLSGWPCPGCGLTTSFAHAARLDFAAAWHAHPFGPLAFLLTLSLIPLSLWLARRHASFADVWRIRLTKPALAFLLLWWLAGWVYKINTIG